MKAQDTCRYDKAAFFIMGLVIGFTIGVAILTWDWFPSDIWWHNPLAVVPQTRLSYISLLSPFVVALVLLIVRRIIAKKANL